MRYNGTLQYQVISSGGYDDNGEPIPSSTEWSEPIKCLLKANTDTRKGRYEDGKFRQASFVALIEKQPLPDIKRIKLTRYAETLGDYDIINIEPLPTVGRTQIIV